MKLLVVIALDGFAPKLNVTLGPIGTDLCPYSRGMKIASPVVNVKTSFLLLSSLAVINVTSPYPCINNTDS